MFRKIIKGLLCIFLIGGATGCASTNQEENANIKNELTEISKEKKTFGKEEDTNKKLAILKKTVQNQDKYKKNVSTDKKAISEYKTTIQNMRDYFVSDYENRLKDNSIDDVNSIQDKAQLEDKKTQLNTLKEDLDKEFKYTLDSKDKYQEYSQKISDIVDRYDERISAIDEEQKQAEIAKQQEAQRTYSNEFFTIVVPVEWGSNWSVEEDTSQARVMDGVPRVHVYRCSRSGGGAEIYAINMSDYGIDEAHCSSSFYRGLIPVPEEQQHYLYSPSPGQTSAGWAVFVQNVAASFIDDGEAGHTDSLATITLH